ncbi:MAG: lipocalin-like domain-containing protein [Thermoanaerobaculales bacterium]|nr:lipocalin-like domain-containing protein [Thermoanaerobaculales bacterium]
MRRLFPAVLLLAFLSLTTVAWRSASSPESGDELKGAWIATGWKYAGVEVATPQRGLLVFTDDHYSIMFVDSSDPRPQYTGDNMTDAEIQTAYKTFVANSGRYAASGDVLTTKAYVAKDPNYMAGWEDGCVNGPCKNEVAMTFKITGDDLQLTWPGQKDGVPQLVGTFHRVE